MGVQPPASVFFGGHLTALWRWGSTRIGGGALDDVRDKAHKDRADRRSPARRPADKADSIVLHDYFGVPDGGGRTSLLLAQTLDADLAFGYRVAGHPYFDRPLPMQTIDLGCSPSIPLLRQIGVARAFAQRTGFLGGYRRALYSGSYAPLAVAQGGADENIAYCHTPPRFVYDQREHFLRQLAAWQRPMLRAFITWFRPRYVQSMRAMDRILCNSEAVRRRIRDYLDLDATIVHPACDTARFRWIGQGDYYLSTGRLDDLKRVDLCVRAFAALPDKKLVVVSGGAQESRLRALAAGADNIELLGEVSEQRLGELMGGAIATLYLAVDEDFGLSPVESMAAGKPVIGVAAGGLLETQVDGETGLLLSADPDVAELVAAVQAMTPARALAMRAACERRAGLFSETVFSERLGVVLADG